MDSFVLTFLSEIPQLLDKSLPVAFLWFICAKIFWPVSLKLYHAVRGQQYWVLDEHWERGKFWKKGSDWGIGFLLLVALSLLPHGELFIYSFYIIAILVILVGSAIGESITKRIAKSGANHDDPVVINFSGLKTIPHEWLSEQITVSVGNGQLHSDDLTDDGIENLQKLRPHLLSEDEMWVFYHNPHQTGWVYEGMAIRRKGAIIKAVVTNAIHLNYGGAHKENPTNHEEGAKAPHSASQKNSPQKEQVIYSPGDEVLPTKTLLRKKTSDQTRDRAEQAVKLQSSVSSSLIAYSPDPAYLGAVFVKTGEELSPSQHLELLSDRLDTLLEMSEDPESLRRQVENEFLLPAGLQVGPNSWAGDWVNAIEGTGSLKLQGAVYGRNVRVEKDDPEARAHLLAEREEPDQALLAWISFALHPILSEPKVQE